MQKSIKLWIQQIQQKPIASLSLIKDTTYLHSILYSLDPSFFPPSPPPTYDPLIQLITSYYKTILLLDVSQSILLARKSQDSIQLWVLVLGIAIRCSQRNSYIQLILNMDQKTQSSLMGFISRIDDTLAGCPSLELQGSKKQNTNLEKHLLSTIDQLMEQNGGLKTRIEDLEDEMNSLKVIKENRIDSLQKEINQLHGEREDILNDYQGVYNTDNLTIIFKAIINENNLFKEIIEKREGIADNVEREKEEILKQLEKVVQENRILKIDVMEMSNLQGKIEEQQEQIGNLRKNQNQLLNKVFVLQRGSGLNRFQNKNFQRHFSVQPQHNIFSTSIQNTQQQLKPKKSNKYTERLLRSIKQQGSSLLQDLSLDQRQRQYISTISLQQTQIESLTNEIQKIKDQVQIKKTQIKYSTDKNKEIEEKLRYLEEIKEVYEKNMKIKETVFSQTNQEYAERFGRLMAEIESLNENKQKSQQRIKENEEQHKNNSKRVQGEYEEKLSRVMGMMEGELIGFRNKELEYLQVIRQLKESKGGQFFNSVMELGRSAFKMERSNSMLESIQEEKGEMGKSQVKEKSEIENKQVKQQNIKNEQQNLVSNKILQDLNLKITQLQIQITNLTIRNQQVNNQFITLAKQSKQHISQNLQLKQQLSNEKLLLQQFTQKISLFLQNQLQRLKLENNSTQQEIKKQVNGDVNDQHIKKLEQIVGEIRELKEQRNSNTDELINHQNRLRQFLKNQLQQMFKFIQFKQKNQQNSNNNQKSTNQQELDRMKRQKAQKYDRYNLLHKQYQSIKHQNKSLSKQLITLKSQNITLHKQSLTLQQQKSILQQKIIQLQYQLSNNKSASLQNYTQVSELLHQIQRERLNINQIKMVQQTNVERENEGEKSVFKDVNDKLVRELEKQNMCLELFRRQYRELYQKYQQTEQEHRLLLGVMVDLVQEVIV